MEALDFFRQIGVRERIVDTMIHQENIQELDGLKKAILDSSATSWNIQIAVPVGRAKDLSYMYLNPHQLRHLFDFIKKTREVFNVEIAEPAGYLGSWDTSLRPEPFFCGAGIETCSIMHLSYPNFDMA